MNVSHEIYITKFLELIENSLQNSYIIHLSNCKKSIKLFKKEFNLYVNFQDIQYILAEIFNITIPVKINVYLENILTPEPNIDSNSDIIEERVCITKIDANFFESVRLWLKNNPKQLDNFASDILCRPIGISSDRNNYNVSNVFTFENSSLPSFNKTEKNKFVVCKKNLNYKKPVVDDNVDERPFTCNFIGCKKAFKRLEHLKRHKKIHSGEKPFLCTYPGCNKLFSRSDNLSTHYKIHIIKKKRKIPEKTLV